MSDRIIHKYFDIRQDILWDAKEFELADIKERLIFVLKKEKLQS